MSQAISGANGTVHVGAVNADVSSVNLEIDVDTFDTTTTADGGYEDITPSVKKITGSFDFFYNVTKKPTGGSLTLTPGTVVGTLTVYVDEVNAPGETYAGPALVTKLSLKSKVKDGWVVTASFHNKGAWTLPT